MKDLIDRNELLKVFEEDCSDDAWWFIDQVEKAPRVEAEPVVHAHWIPATNCDVYGCSNCGGEHDWHYARCHYCGAKMDEEVG